MTSTSEPALVFLDASVLAAPTTRSLILYAVAHWESSFRVCWSLQAEAEADAALKRRAAVARDLLGRTTPPVLVSELRKRSDWGKSVIVPSAPELEKVLVNTSSEDRHVLAAAAAAHAGTVLTVDVDDFDVRELNRFEMVAANPDLFLRWNMTVAMYEMALESMATHRILPPNTAESIHASLASAHPRLAAAMTSLFPDVELARATGGTPGVLYRGSRCLACGHTVPGISVMEDGVHERCRSLSDPITVA